MHFCDLWLNAFYNKYKAGGEAKLFVFNAQIAADEDICTIFFRQRNTAKKTPLNALE